jgi:putative Mg2+ transporter-C (MgtC) family protein
MLFWSEYDNYWLIQIFLSLLNPLEIIFRLLCALFFGAIIGFERQIQNKAEGLRTYKLVSLGSATFVLIPVLLDNNSYDAFSRTIQGIATGIGFLGAGEIWRDTQLLLREVPSAEQARVHGLTSAASIWVTATLGIAAGFGLWQLGLFCD